MRLLILLLVTASFANGAPDPDAGGIFSIEREAGQPHHGFAPDLAPLGPDTILYDDGYGYWYSTSGIEWGVRFTTILPCTLEAVLTMTFGPGEACSLFVRDDSLGRPGPIVRDTAYTGGAYPGWDRIGLSQPYFDQNSFWVTGRYAKPPYIIADSSESSGRSYYTFDGTTWMRYTSGDLMIRAVVAYGDTLQHDVSAVRLSGTPTGVCVDSQYADSVQYTNLGSSVESFTAGLLVMDSLGLVELDTSAGVDSLPPMRQRWETFVWTPMSYGQTYSVAGFSVLSGDQNPGNDTFFTAVCSYMESEMWFDDFSSEMWLNVDMDDDDKFAVRFLLPDTPRYVSGARFFVDDTVTVQSLALCPDSGGLPDTGNPYLVVSGLSAERPASWIWVPFDTSATRVDRDTVWLVMTWPDSRSGPHVGSDRSYPIDGNSWAYSYSTGWVNWTESDFMMRIVCPPATGVEERASARPASRGELEVAPNPFCGSAVLRVETPLDCGDPSVLSVYDAAGRPVKVFDDLEVNELKAGGTVEWSGTDNNGRELGSGVYFFVLRAGRGVHVSKAILLD